MATAEQLPGELDVEIIQGDDLNLQLEAVGVNYSGYTFVTTVHALHGGETTVQTALSAGSATSWIQVDFPATTTAALAVTGDEGAHNWKIVYTDTSNLTRTWVKGAFTVLTRV
jgi:hypothetical protein